mmetsp:Transcript_34891/g.68887  ORF Transcript_34891/g.68887 Transcript_34891/m.68887 type:complete len:162 (-) Transcript_34891:838-1323(-)
MDLRGSSPSISPSCPENVTFLGLSDTELLGPASFLHVVELVALSSSCQCLRRLCWDEKETAEFLWRALETHCPRTFTQMVPGRLDYKQRWVAAVRIMRMYWRHIHLQPWIMFDTASVLVFAHCELGELAGCIPALVWMREAELQSRIFLVTGCGLTESPSL